MARTREEWTNRSAKLVALLDLIERPAAVLAPDGALLGANARFAALAEEIGLPEAAALPPLLATSERGPLAARLAAAAAGGSPPGGREPGSGIDPIQFIDGVRRGVRIECHGDAGPDAVLLAVVDSRPPDSAPRARATLSHDLAGPLTAILGTAELLLIRGADLPDSVRGSLGDILDNCGRITEILARERDARARRDDGADRDG